MGTQTLARRSSAVRVTKAQIRQLMSSVGASADVLERDVAKIVELEGWTVMGFSNFTDMWVDHMGYEVPRTVSNYLVFLYEPVLANESRQGAAPSVVAKETGIPAARIKRVAQEIRSGVPVSQIGSRNARARNTPRKLGKGPDELTPSGASVPRWMDDAMDALAKKAGAPKTEIYRQAVEQYLARLGVDKMSTGRRR